MKPRQNRDDPEAESVIKIIVTFIFLFLFVFPDVGEAARPVQNINQLTAQALPLKEKQKLFTRLFVEMLIFANLEGYEVVLETGHRSPQEARRLVKERRNIAILNSLHILKLAHDISLHKGKIYLRDTEDYRELGEYFESIGGTWGGHFGDGNHFSIEHKGVR